MASGIADAMTTDEGAQRLERLTRIVSETAARVAVDAILSEMASGANEQRIERIAAAVANGAVDRAMSRMAHDFPTEVGPAVATMIHDEIGPSVRGMIEDPQVRQAMDSAAFELARQSVLGSNEASLELAKQKSQRGGLVARLSAIFSAGGVIVAIVLFLLVLAVVALIVSLVRQRAHMRQYVTERAAVEHAEREMDRAGGHRVPS